jgi:hypothetical protein
LKSFRKSTATPISTSATFRFQLCAFCFASRIFGTAKQIRSMNNHARVFAMPFANVYPLYIQKAEKKGRTKEEVDTIIFWLTGYNKKSFQQHLDRKSNFETFFNEAPQFHPNASKITGVICGYRVEEIEDELMQKIRYLDKLIDELAKGKKMEKILRA